MIEASGLVASRKQPDVLWVHNDSGNAATLYALGRDGRDRGSYQLTGCACIDWEDIALGPGPASGVDYLYVADSGTNNLARDVITVYRVPEPQVLDRAQTSELAGSVTLRFSYPGHRVHDAETLFIDPRGGDLYLVTKSAAGDSGIYRAVAPLTEGKPHQLELVTLLEWPDTGARGATRATGGDISPDGGAIILKTYTQALWFSRGKAESVASAFARAPCALRLADEPQGEAIGFSADGAGYYTVSEGTHQPIYYFALQPPRIPAPAQPSRVLPSP